MDIYKQAVRPFLFNVVKADPELMHNYAIASLKGLANVVSQPGNQWLNSRLQGAFGVNDRRLHQLLFGLNFPNPVGLAAGFDKDGVAAAVWGSLGFGFAELGTVTWHAQPGNPQPRLFRLPQDLAALNRMGFNNQGAQALSQRLQALRSRFTSPIPLGINLGKSKITPLESAAEDYCQSFRLLQPYGDYFVINVSSPNTPGLRSLQDATMLSTILAALQAENSHHKPIFVKIAPDLELDAIADIIQLAKTYGLAGIIATNTTISREGLKTQIIPTTGKPPQAEAGGISGLPVRDRATDIIRYIYQQTDGKLPIIGVGGIFTAADAWDKITAGACLVQVYTGWIYEGPVMVRRILTGLIEQLEQHQLNSISEAIGLNAKKYG
ncbi:quinone-dependent dihydroorotate dehydrogenase [Calothrix sp. NIES-3974]|uniref:quinone-dependent dihydroorotate dehydrogenase n=1 Tax=Calothrix sp. NIES-3974 TaxID=2005462 RepID=UPI000B5E7DF5|nr:quinone-dependent dihydroorotate dehydrogenase [Calothrix sp. NIES-3974]BAZ06320.1 dihydroorotate dehydrogenase 2 [Calothrix sp. NIES-3974]